MEPSKQPDHSGDIVSPSSPERMDEDNPAVPEEFQPVEENNVEEDGEESDSPGILVAAAGPLNFDGKILTFAEGELCDELLIIMSKQQGSPPPPGMISDFDPNDMIFLEDSCPPGFPSPEAVAEVISEFVASRRLQFREVGGGAAEIIVDPSSFGAVPTKDAKEEIKGETKDEIKDETQDETKDEIKDEIQDETRDETQDKTKDEIKDETHDEELLPLELAPNNKRGF